jgi:hypothetical protein
MSARALFETMLPMRRHPLHRARVDTALIAGYLRRLRSRPAAPAARPLPQDARPGPGVRRITNGLRPR